MKVVTTDFIHADQDFEQAELARAGIDFAAHQLKFQPAEKVLEAVSEADAIVVNMVPFPAELIERLPRCRLLIRHGIGYDNVDVAACTRQGIQFANQPAYCAHEVAEHAVSLILAMARKLHQARTCLEQSSQAGDWNFTELFPLQRFSGATVGIFGLGRIGSLVARKLRGFDVRLLACDPIRRESEAAELGVRFVDRETLFREADYLSLHAPVTPETNRCVNIALLSLMKPSAVLINTARASLVRTDDLVDCLRERRIAGAALDVFDIEPPRPDDPLFQLPNVLLSPHLGWASEQAMWQIRKDIVADLITFASGGNARHVINRETLRPETIS